MDKVFQGIHRKSSLTKWSSSLDMIASVIVAYLGWSVSHLLHLVLVLFQLQVELLDLLVDGFGSVIHLQEHTVSSLELSDTLAFSRQTYGTFTHPGDGIREGWFGCLWLRRSKETIHPLSALQYLRKSQRVCFTPLRKEAQSPRTRHQ